MKKNIKIVLGLTLGLAVAGMVSQPTKVDAKSKFVTVQQAGKKIYNAQERAYKGKKKTIAKLYFKAGSEKAAEKLARKAFIEAAKYQFGKAYQKGLYCLADYHHGVGVTACSSTKVSGGYLLTWTINGKSKKFRSEYREMNYFKKLVIELRSFTNRKGLDQFDKAWLTMAWFQARSGYMEGRHKNLSYKSLYQRKYYTDCDGLGHKYALFARMAGVKHVGTAAAYGHVWNWIEVDGVKYYIDYQGANYYGPTSWSIKQIMKYAESGYSSNSWWYLDELNQWYKENVDSEARPADNCKAIWNKMNNKQRAEYQKSHNVDDYGKYELTCDSYAKTQFQPAKAFCANSSSFKLKDVKTWGKKQVTDSWLFTFVLRDRTCYDD